MSPSNHGGKPSGGFISHTRAQQWATRIGDRAAFHRAGGRKRFNAIRLRKARKRRARVAAFIQAHGCPWGVQARLARLLGVNRSTICRDLDALEPKDFPREVLRAMIALVPAARPTRGRPYKEPFIIQRWRK